MPRAERLTLVLLAALALTACSKPPETFEAEGIRLHDAFKECDAEIGRLANVPGAVEKVNKDPKFRKAWITAINRCGPASEAEKAYVARAKELRAAGIIR
jgi:hypothetical protein